MAAKLLAFEIAKVIDQSSYFTYELMDYDYSFNSLLEEVENMLSSKEKRKNLIESLEELQECDQLHGKEYLINLLETM